MNTLDSFPCEERYKFESKYYTIVLTIFLATWNVSNIAAIKLVSFFGITLTGGFLIFPFTSALISLIVDVYGYKLSRQAIWCGFLMSLTFLFFINIINLMPNAPEWQLQDQFQKIIVPQNRIFIASLIAFWVSGFSNSYFMAKFKYAGQSLGKRIFISSFISIFIDITVFFLIAFAGSIPFPTLKTIYFFAFIKKLICEIALLPLILMFIDKFKQMEGFEIIDNNTNFNPFTFDNIYDLDSYRKQKGSVQTKKAVLT